MTPLERQIARLTRFGFTTRQARALAEADHDVVFLPIDRLFFFAPSCNYRHVIPGGAR